MQTSRSLFKASFELHGRLIPDVKEVVQQLVDSCVRFAWDDTHGGFYYLAEANKNHFRITSKEKKWWVQAEGLRALLALAVYFDDSSVNYFDYFERDWNYIRENIIDPQYKGWNAMGLDTSKEPMAKADVWKDASHEVRAMIECIQFLDKLINER